MRFTIRRLRRKLPNVMIVLGSWNAEADTTVLADAVKADGVALTLHGAAKRCLEEASRDAAGRKVGANNSQIRNVIDAAGDARAAS
jgi:hypothetical protein